MSQQGLNVSEVINISTTIQAGGGGRSEFGTGLLITSSKQIPADGSGKVQRFTSYNDVVNVFNDTGDSGSRAVDGDAAIWFGADPQPKPLYIGRWANKENEYTRIITGNYGTLTYSGNIVFKCNFQGNDLTVTLTSGGNEDTLLQAFVAKINTLSGYSGVSATSALSSSGLKYATINFNSYIPIKITKSTNLGSAKDLAEELKLTSEYVAQNLQGSAKESLKSCLSKCIGLSSGGEPTALMLDSSLEGNVDGDIINSIALAEFAQGGDYMCGLRSWGVTKETNFDNHTDDDNLALAKEKNWSHVISIYDDANARPDIAVLAKLSSQNFDLPASLVSLPPKTLVGVTTTPVNSKEIENLKSKRASVYTTVGGYPAFLGGYTSKDGVWADSQWWLLWLKNEMEREIFVSLRSSRRANASLLLDAINSVMGKAVRSGGAKPGGVVSDAIKHDIRAITGNHNFDGVLSTGYLVWIDPLQSQSQSDRENRIARFKVWIAPSEAIHTVDGAIVLSGG